MKQCGWLVVWEFLTSSGKKVDFTETTSKFTFQENCTCRRTDNNSNRLADKRIQSIKSKHKGAASEPRRRRIGSSQVVVVFFFNTKYNVHGVIQCRVSLTDPTDPDTTDSY